MAAILTERSGAGAQGSIQAHDAAWVLPSALSGWQLRPGRGRLWHHDIAEPVSRLPLPARGHRACGLALSLLQPELARCWLILAARGIVVSCESIREWGRALRPDLRQCTEGGAGHNPATSGTWTSVYTDPRQATLSLARGRPGR